MGSSAPGLHNAAAPLLTSPPPAPTTFWGHPGWAGGGQKGDTLLGGSQNQNTPWDPIAQCQPPFGGQPNTPKPSPRFGQANPGPTALSLPPDPTRSPSWFPTELLAQHAAFGVLTAPGAGLRGVPYTPGDPHPIIPPHPARRQLEVPEPPRAHPSCRNGVFISHELEQVWIKITRLAPIPFLVPAPPRTSTPGPTRDPRDP